MESSKSLVLSCALFERRLSIKEAADLARLEVRYQVGVALFVWQVALCAEPISAEPISAIMLSLAGWVDNG